MARLESIAVAGYFPTPAHLLSAVAALCEAAEGAHTDAVADPCAGKGEALLALLGAWYPEREPGTLSTGSRATAHVFAAELEGSRYKALETALYNFRGGKGRVQSHRGDAFRLDLGLTDHRPPAGLTCLYLNPPYDHDARFKRLEERFLQRFMPALMTGGVLLFVVPVHALSASLDTLGTWAQDVEVLRFPDPDYAVFKQVVVRARRRPGQLPVADPVVVEALRAAMSDPLGLPTIDGSHKPYTFPVAPMTLDWRNRPQPGEAGIGWKAALLDEGALFATHKAWHQTARNGSLVTAARVFPKTALGSLRARYPMAVPPKPGHVAAAIAAGVFNGETLCADDSTTEAPPIIVKGRFARVWRTTEEKRNMEGETTGHVQVEEPRLEVTALDLRELVFCDLKSSPLPSGSQEPSSMTTGDLLTQYGNGLLTTLRAHCPVLHDPADPSHVIPLVQTARPLYAAQAHAAMACVKLLGGPGVPRARRKGTFAFLIGEVGCLRGETPIQDPVDGSTSTVSERHRKGEPFHVWALGPHGPVIAGAMPPKRYAPAQMVRVTSADGSSIVVTPAHRFWDGSEWVRASDVALRLLATGQARLASSSGSALSAHARGGTRWTESTQGSPGDCPPDPRCGGAPPLPASGSAPALAPSPAGALGRSPLRPGTGARERGAAHSRFCPPCDPRPMPGSGSPAEGPASGPPLPQPGSRPTRGSGSTPARALRSRGPAPLRTSSGPVLDVLPSTPVSSRAFESPTDGVEPTLPQHHPAVQPRDIVAVEPLDAAPYFDFHVPVFNNYWAAGLWHHNSGKSCTFLVVARTIGARRTLMVCPPHLLSSWDDEVKAAWPEARVVTLASVNDIDALAAEKADGGDQRPVVAVLSREGAKLGHGWATVPRCGECGAPAHAGDHAERRSTCLARIPTPTTPDELYASRLMAVMVGHTPALQGKPRCTPMHALRYALDLAVAAGRWATALLIGECFADASARLNVVKRVPVNTEDDLRLLLSVPPETPGWLSEVIRRIGEHDEAGRKSVAVFRAWAAYIHHDKRRPEDWNQYGRVYAQDGVLRVEGRTVGTPDALGVVLAALPAVPFRVCGAPLYQAIPSPRRTALATYIARRHPELFDIVGLDECFVAGTRVSGRAIETIRVGDTVRSFDEAAGVFVTRPVTRLYRNPPRALVRVWLSDGRALVCTPGHPFLTPDGWRAAGALTSADIVRTTSDDQGEEGMDGGVRALRCTPDVDGWRDARSEQRTAEGPRLLQPGMHERGARGVEPGRNAREASGGSGTTEAMGGPVSNVHDPVHPDRGSGVRGEDAGVRLLLSGLHEGNAQPADRGCDGALLNPGCGPDRCEDERPEPDGGPERASAHGGYAATDRAPPARAGGQRPGADGAATTASGSPRLGDGGPDRDGFAPSPGASDALHARHRGPGPEDRGGGRRGLAHGACSEAPGRSEGRLLPWVGVDRVEVLEPGSDGTYGGLCPDGLVYNLEVEGTHTYDAEGVVVHNCHELSGDGSAQERAAHRITGTRAPTVLLTGSILNGYAAHLFPHLWALDPKFREAFKRDDRGKFAKQYGYRRRFVAEPTGGKASKRGKVTDRVEGAVRDMGESPGVQPTAILHWLLPHAVTLHKGDLEVHIPPLTITRVAIHPTEEMASRHKAALVDLMRQIKEDRFTDMAGALWGQLTLAPSHLDRMTVDVCGSPDGAWTVAYPEHRGGAVVHRGECFPADTVLPKERWMLDELQRQIARGRATIVLSHHVELMPRYARLIREHLKLKVSVLDANKVSPAKRKAWIQAQNAAGAQVLLTNPVAIGTGLNVLVFYATELWMENPGCNAITFRQAVGRIDRIGQTKPTEVYFPVYEDTIQGPAHTLLLQKVAVSQSTDGLDARSALQAAGVGDAPDVSALSIGKLLFDLLDKSADLRRAIAAATPRTR